MHNVPFKYMNFFTAGIKPQVDNHIKNQTSKRSVVTPRVGQKMITLKKETLGNVQMFLPEMHLGLTILGPPPVGRHRT